MYNKDDILAALQNGKTTDEIADDFTKALNAAIQEKKTIDEDMALITQKEKVEAAQDIIDIFNSSCEMYWPNLTANVTAENVVELFDNMQSLMITTYKYFNSPKAKSKLQDFDSVVADFFNKQN